MGAYLYDNGESDECRAFVHHGSPEGLATSADLRAEGDQEGEQFGTSAALVDAIAARETSPPSEVREVGSEEPISKRTVHGA